MPGGGEGGRKLGAHQRGHDFDTLQTRAGLRTNSWSCHFSEHQAARGGEGAHAPGRPRKGATNLQRSVSEVLRKPAVQVHHGLCFAAHIVSILLNVCNIVNDAVIYN